VDRARMKLFDVEQSAQTLVNDIPVFDQSTSGQRMKNERSKNFSGIKA